MGLYGMSMAFVCLLLYIFYICVVQFGWNLGSGKNHFFGFFLAAAFFSLPGLGSGKNHFF